MFIPKNELPAHALHLLAFSIPSQAEEITIRDLIHAQGCKGCHIIEGTGGTFGPSLDKVGQRLPLSRSGKN